MVARTERHIDRVADGTTVTERNDTDARDVTQVRIPTVEGGGHAWPGRRRADRGGGKQEIGATADVPRFFAEHP